MLFHHLQGTNTGVDIEQFVGDLREWSIDAVLLATPGSASPTVTPILRTRLSLDRRRSSGAGGARVDRRSPLDGARSRAALASGEQDDPLDEFMTRTDCAASSSTPRRSGASRCSGSAPDHHRLVFTYHHSLLDTSVVWVVEEVFQTYDASVRGEVARARRAPRATRITCLAAPAPRRRSRRRAGVLPRAARRLRRTDDLVALERSVPLDEATAFGYGADRFRLSIELSEAIHGLQRLDPARAGGAHRGGVGAGARGVLRFHRRGVRLHAGMSSFRHARAATRIMGLFINTPPVRMCTSIRRPRARACSMQCADSRSTSAPTSTRRSPTSRRLMDTRPARCSTPSS